MKKKFTAMSLVMAIVMSVFAFQFAPLQAEAAGKTGVGLAEHVLNCYYGGWQYEYGYAGQVVNGVHLSDCSGMIYAYTGTARSSSSQIGSASASGSVSSIPRIHGLGLWMQGHVGVYVGGGMAVDCRDYGYNVVYEGVTQHRWVKWYKVPGVTYPTTGWVTFQGNKYYYENGQYVVNTTKTIDGVTYTFGWNGKITSSNGTPVSGGNDSEPSKSPSNSTGNAGASNEGSSVNTGSSNTGAATQTQSSSQANTEVTYTDLGLASQGAAVYNLQQRLFELGYYYDMVNDYYDAFIQDAVLAYQKANGLEATGTADVKTQKSLFKSDAKKNPDKGTLYPGLHTGLVRLMQERLVSLGYLSSDVELSSYYGDATKAAVLAYQKESGLKEDGIMDAEALEVLYSDEAVAAPIKEEPEDTSSSEEASDSSKESKESEESEVTILEAMVPTAYAAEIAETADSVKDNDSNTTLLVFVVVLLCAGLTTGVFFIQRKGGIRPVVETIKTVVFSNKRKHGRK